MFFLLSVFVFILVQFGFVSVSFSALNNNLANKVPADFTSISNLDDAPFGVSFAPSGVTNNPFSFWTSVTTLRLNANSYKVQYAMSFSSGESGEFAVRTCDSGTWADWDYLVNKKYFNKKFRYEYKANGETFSLSSNVPYLIIGQGFSTNSCGYMAVVLGGYAPTAIFEKNISLSANGSTLTVTSGIGPVYFTLIRLS